MFLYTRLHSKLVLSCHVRDNWKNTLTTPSPGFLAVPVTLQENHVLDNDQTKQVEPVESELEQDSLAPPQLNTFNLQGKLMAYRK